MHDVARCETYVLRHACVMHVRGGCARRGDCPTNGDVCVSVSICVVWVDAASRVRTSHRCAARLRTGWSLTSVLSVGRALCECVRGDVSCALCTHIRHRPSASAVRCGLKTEGLTNAKTNVVAYTVQRSIEHRPYQCLLLRFRSRSRTGQTRSVAIVRSMPARAPRRPGQASARVQICARKLCYINNNDHKDDCETLTATMLQPYREERNRNRQRGKVQ